MFARAARRIGLPALLLLVAACGGEAEALTPQDEDDTETKVPSPIGGDGGAGDPGAASEPIETWLTTLPYVVVANGHGPAEKDRSNGDVAEATAP